MIMILYQDRDLVVCVKPAHVISEADGLPALLKDQLGGEFFCVHRLDRETAGLMVVARNGRSAAKLSEAFAGRNTEKEYFAVAEGEPEERHGAMRDLLYHDTARNKTFVVQRERHGVREAALTWKCLETVRPDDLPMSLSLFRVSLETGRSHQIRVQFAHRHMPLVGDQRYGSGIRSRELALWSCRISFPHPANGRLQTFSLLPPADGIWARFGVLGCEENEETGR